jgi:lipopolysaccharide export system protein LptA
MRRLGFRSVLLWAAWSAVLAPGAFGQESFRMSADSLSRTFSQGRERAVLSGDAEIISESTEIRADEIELYGEDFRYAVARGNLTVLDTERDIYLTGDLFRFDRELEIAQVEGNAIMEDRENEVVVRSGFLEARLQDDIIIMQVGVRIFQDDLVTRSEFARFDRGSDVLELSGLPIVFWEEDEYEAARIVINLETEDISLQGEVSGRIVRSDTGESEAGPTEPQMPPDGGVEEREDG